jgi:hypothetical protein
VAVPALGPAEKTGPPDFVGIGVQQAGSTWWYCLVASHPEIHDPPGRPIEVHFFDQFWAQAAGTNPLADYQGYFPRPPGKKVGEFTPRYLYDYWTAPLILAAAPQVRFLVLLRDPIERYAAGIAHEIAHGAPRHATVATDAAQRGLYALQLTRLFAEVEPSRVLVLQYEACRADVGAALGATYEFLEVGTDHVPETAGCDDRLAETRSASLDDAIRERLRMFYEPDVRQLLDMVPGLRVGLWPNFGHLAG